jgi:2-polyprenyl-3-methyl-5-hydroxy-6-metoxy-1,4-benzoquinol methylase
VPCPICGAQSATSGDRLADIDILACSSCGHHFAEPCEPVRYDDEYKTGIYRETLVAEALEAAASGSLVMQTSAAFFRTVPKIGARRVLDVACGTGRFAAAAAEAGWDVTGFDASEEAISVAKRIFGSRADFHVGDLESIPPQTYDVVTCFEFVEHTADPIATLNRLSRHVAPGGALFVTVPNWGSKAVRATTLPEWSPPIHLQFFTRRSLLRALRSIERKAKALRGGFYPPRTSIFPLSQHLGGQQDGLWAMARF